MRTVLLALLLAALAGCGFHLRGQADLPPAMAATYIDIPQAPGSPPSNLKPVLRRILEANGITVTDAPETATARLEVLAENARSRTIATDERGNVRETTLVYEVLYQVRTADGGELIPPDQVRLTRDILYPETEVLGRFEGEQLALRDMLDDAAYAIVRRIQALSRRS